MVIKLSDGAKTIIKRLTDNGYSAYAVGGCIRDSIMGKTPYDFDITTNATTDEMLKIFSDCKTLTTGIKHGTVGIVINKEIYECTTYRIDGNYTDSRHPDKVYFSKDLKDDLSRRDFTVNSLCYNEKDGLIDLFAGIADIENKIIRCIGEPDKRFNEDALRILRGLRFSSVLSFSIDENTKNAMIKSAPLLDNISKERKTEEIKKLLTGDNLLYVINRCPSIFSFLFPETEFTAEFIRILTSAPKDFEYRLSLIVRNSKKPESVFSALCLSKSVTLTVNQLSQINPPKDKIELKKMLSRYKKENVIKHIECTSNKKAQKYLEEIENGNECYNLQSLKISGNDVLKAGFLPEETGKILNTVLNEVIEEKILNERNTLIKFIKKLKIEV